MVQRLFLYLSFMLLCLAAYAQDSSRVIQLSGQISDNMGLVPLYTNVSVVGTNRGTVCRIDGFYSLPVRTGETIIYSNIGYMDQEFVVPHDAEGTFVTNDVVLQKDTIFLNPVTIRPWPDRDFFEIEFLALDVDNYLEDIAYQNLSPERLEILRQFLPVDGGEVAKIELQRTAAQYYSVGQIRPQNILNPLSWKKFIDALRRGDFKKKDKK